MSTLLDAMIAWEDGELEPEETIDLFQELVSSDMIPHLQGCYGRYAEELAREGFILAS